MPPNEAAPEAVAPAAPAPSLLAGVPAPTDQAPAPVAAAPDAAAVNGDDWLPEKFRVAKDDGTVDEGASARKLAESYKALEAHKGPIPQAPATPDDYKIEPPKGADGKPIEGMDLAAFTADPLFKAFAKDAHAVGYTNEQMQLAMDKYLTLAPELMAANQVLTAQEARAELATLWTDDKTMNSNLSSVVRSINAFGGAAPDMPGSIERLNAKFGSDSDFIAFAAAVAKDMREDTVPSQTGLPSEVDVDALQKSKAYWDPNDPDHARVKAKVSEFYARKHGTAAR